MNELWPWVALILLGAYHGLNPGMGWLFAVALGLQEGNRTGVFRAFIPIALGHAASIAAIVVLVLVAQAVVATEVLSTIGAVALVVFGLYKLFSSAHPRWVGMRVNFRDLTIWSFLMASAHGAGLMLVPVLLQLSAGAQQVAHAAHNAHAHHTQASAMVGAPGAELAAVTLHTIAMFIVMGAIAIIVYEKLGVAVLRRAWFNLDRVWAIALILTGIVSIAL